MNDPQPDASHPPSPRVFGPAFLAYGLLWLSFPPARLSPVAWFALVPLLELILLPTLGQRRPYWKLYASGVLYWLATFYFIPIPHPALWAGWAAVSLYMACYTPLSIAVCRVLVHRARVPAAVAIPMVWVGVEWIRCHFATGMGMACLSHSQAWYPTLIQTADLSGAYAVTFIMILFASCLAIAKHNWQANRVNDQHLQKSRWLAWAAVAVVVFVVNLGYGWLRTTTIEQTPTLPPLKVGLIQTSQDALFRPLAELELTQRINETIRLTNQAMQQQPDLICWPESGLVPYRLQLADVDRVVTAGATRQLIQEYWRQAVVKDLSGGAPLLTGLVAQNAPAAKIYNSAILIDRDGQLQERYDKVHPVMFGEYIPFGKMFPILERLAPMRSIEFGRDWVSYQIKEHRVAPNICFESTIPHLIRRQVNDLARRGQEPDVLINLTNDGWFFGTACLDHHLACNIFRAVEMRKPLLACANTGLSASIDHHGRLQAVGNRRQPQTIVASAKPIKGVSCYRSIGDIIPTIFGVAVILTAVIGWFKAR